MDGCGEFGEEAVEFRFVYCPFVHVLAPVAQEASVNPAVYGGDADSRPLRGLLGCDNCGHWFPLVMVAIDDMIEKVSPRGSSPARAIRSPAPRTTRRPNNDGTAHPAERH